MLHILILILKIIGILLLVLLFILLIAVVSILFIPVNYKIHAEKEKSFVFKANVSWFFRLVHFQFTYEKKSFYECYIFGIPLSHLIKPKQNSKKRDHRTKQAEIKNAENYDQQKKEQNIDHSQEKRKPQKETNKDYTAEGFYDKLKKWKAILNSEDLQWIIKMTLSELKTLIKKVMPEKIKGNIEIGFDDPANTGQFLGVIGMLFPILPEDLIIIPNFTESVFKGWIDAKGKIFGGFILKEIIKILLDGRTVPIVKKYMHKEA